MAKAVRVSAISILKSSIAALEKQIAEMKRGADVLAVSQGMSPIYNVVQKEPTVREVRQELPSGDFRIDAGTSFASDHQD